MGRPDKKTKPSTKESPERMAKPTRGKGRPFAPEYDVERFREEHARHARIMKAAGDDITLNILWGQLLIEEKVFDFLKTVACQPDFIDRAGLRFFHALNVARALDVKGDQKPWEAIVLLNQIRNKLAHHLEPEDLAQNVDRFAAMIVPMFPWQMKDGTLAKRDLAGASKLQSAFVWLVLWISDRARTISTNRTRR